MIEHSFTTENIDYKNSYLSVVVEADSFCYGIFDNNFTLLEMAKVESPFATSMHSSQVLSRKYKKKIALDKSESIHLPLGIEGNDLLTKHLVALPHATTYSDQILDQKATSNFFIKRELKESLEEKNNSFELTHISTVMCHYLYPSLSKKVMLYISEKNMHICVFNAEGFRFYNQYKCIDANDFLYYLMAIYQLLELDQENTPLIISGRIDRESSIVSLIQNYFAKIEFVSPSIFKLGNTASHNNTHYYMDLYMAYLCVL